MIEQCTALYSAVHSIELRRSAALGSELRQAAGAIKA
jgi:hypothetical protein